ncbi:MAG: 50S ribosomal protein L10 [Candidatus Eremiobacteraeota bacterium]|nr:50S ribosomal protein L10 [Candidatus Eremiobacteraeota bacterium]
MPTAKKEASIEELRQKVAAAKNLFFTNYAGLTVQQITKLRSELRKDGNTYSVVKNTLFARAAGEELATALADILVGPTGVVFAGEDPVAPAKALRTFADDNKTLDVKAAYVDGKVVDKAAFTALATMPSKQQLQAQVLGMLASPIRNFVGILAANPGGFVRVLSAREKQLAESAT